MKKFIFFCFLCITASLFANPISIIPRPAKIELQQGSFELKGMMKLLAPKILATEATYLQETLQPTANVIIQTEGEGQIELILDAQYSSNPEAYKVEVRSDKLLIRASARAGIFYGIETVKQLLPAESFSAKRLKANWNLPCLVIEDEPAYKWRGVMLDVSRYFYDADYVKRYLDIMAMHKLNVFHWHLIDDAGWRLEIKKYPKLTTIGGFRGEGNNRIGGFYTQEEIKEIVAYAQARNIRVIPEIELPAHTLAAMSAYPYLSCRGEAVKVPTKHFISRDLYCAGKQSTYDFIEDVLTEVVGLFPDEYIHIGGDEARYDRWKECSHCQTRKKELGLKAWKHLQGYMNGHVEKFLKKHNRKIMGWDEILDCGYTNSAAVMVWHRINAASKAARKGLPVVMALTKHAYFDTPESALPGEIPGATWLPPISLEKAYEWHPTPKGLDEKSASNIIGAHATMWSDVFLHKPQLGDMLGMSEGRSEVYMDTLSLPRLSALAEVCWTEKSQRSFADFSQRMRRQYKRYLSAGYHYRLPLPKVEMKSLADGSFSFEATSPIEGGKVCFSTNGDKPSRYSKEMTSAVKVRKKTDFQCVSIAPNGQSSLVYRLLEKNNRFAKYGKQIGVWKSGKIGHGKARAKTYEATGKMNANGMYQISFFYTSGSQRLDIDYIELLKNDRVIKKIKRHGYTGHTSKGNIYKIKLSEYETGASFKIRAGLYGDEGDDSNGVIMLKKVN